MPKASAADAATPSAADAAPDKAVPLAQESPAAADEAPALAWGRWVYTGPPGRIYADIPVTPDPGDVIAWHSPPAADGCWTETDLPESRMPDNHRPEPAEPVKEG